MANPEHLAFVRINAEFFNQWRRGNDPVKPDLSNACIGYANLSDADASNAFSRDAFLRGDDFSYESFRDFYNSKAYIRYARLSNANLSDANLSNSNLRYADLSSANLSDANLSGADLRDTDLSSVQALRTNFQKSTLTGACIEDWNINSSTNLEGVICEYIFLKKGPSTYRERRPSSGNFAQGDFAKLVQKSISTVDLIFRNGINWEAFTHSFQKLQVQAGSDELDIQAIENKGDGDFVIRVHSPPSANKGKIQEFVIKEYRERLKVIEARYERQLRLQGDKNSRDIQNIIEAERQQKNQLIGVMNIMASNQGQTHIGTQINNSKFGGGVASKGGVQSGGTLNYYESPERQDLAEAAAEIQRLLQQLETNNPTASEADKQTFISMGIGPTKKQRLINAIKSGGKTAIEELVDNPYLNVAIAIIEGWKENEGSE